MTKRSLNTAKTNEFKRIAREIGCDDSETAFDKALGKMAKAKPRPGQRKKKK
jgi:hypothetical protein